MADVSVIKLPNGSTYNFKDTSARNSLNAKVAKAGDTMTGDLKFSAGSSTNVALHYDSTNKALDFVFS